ncbi:MAG: GumC family protein, partial [Puniceicoccales bacterium]
MTNSPEQNSPNTTDPVLISIPDIIGILRYRWLPGLSVGLVLSAAVGLVLLLQKPIYEGEALVMVETNPDRVLGSMEDQIDLRGNNLITAMNTHIERLQSRQLAQYITGQLSPQQVELLIAPFLDPDEPDIPPSPAGILRNSFEASSVADSQILSLTGRHPNPQVAAWIPNEYARIYIRYLTQIRSGSGQTAITFLEEQVAAAQKDVEIGEEALQNYRQENNLISIEENQEVVSQELQSLNQALNEHQIALVTIETQIEQISTAGDDIEALARIPGLADTETVEALITQLENLRQERDILSQRYLRRHPAMIENQNTQDALLRQLSAAVDRRKATLEQKRLGIEAEMASLREKVNQTEDRARD